MTPTNEPWCTPSVPRKFIDHKIASPIKEEISAILYEYLIAGNGIFMRAARNEFSASLPLCRRSIKGLPASEPGIIWHRPRIGRYLWQEILIDARHKSSSLEFKEDVYVIYWHKSDGAWRWKAVSRERRWAATIADDSLKEYGEACIELHTHPPGAIHFSRADDLDESGKFRIFAIMVDIHDTPQIRFRCGIYDQFFQIPAAWVSDIPTWLIDLNEIDLVIEKLFT